MAGNQRPPSVRSRKGLPMSHSRGTHACAVPARGEVRYEAHMLDSAASPLVAALPQYERGFRDHLAHARAHWDASQARSQTSDCSMPPHVEFSSNVQAVTSLPCTQGRACAVESFQLKDAAEDILVHWD